MNAGDGYFIPMKSETPNTLATVFPNTEGDLIDIKGDSLESTKILDNDFSERLANFMKNSKNLLENLDKKHTSVKFQNFENNALNKKSMSGGPESPTHTLVELEETLMKIDNSKSKYVQKNYNKRSTDPSITGNQSKTEVTDYEWNSNFSHDFLISSHNNLVLTPVNHAYYSSDLSCQEDFYTADSNISVNKSDSPISCNLDEFAEHKRDKHVKLVHNMAYLGPIKTKEKKSCISNIADFKLALFKKRTNSQKGDNNIGERNEKIESNLEKNSGFQNVIKAILNQNKNLTWGDITSFQQESKETCVSTNETTNADITRYPSPFLSNNLSVKYEVSTECNNATETYLSNDKKCEELKSSSDVSKGNSDFSDKSSSSLNNSSKKSYEKILEISKKSSIATSSNSIEDLSESYLDSDKKEKVSHISCGSSKESTYPSETSSLSSNNYFKEEMEKSTILSKESLVACFIDNISKTENNNELESQKKNDNIITLESNITPFVSSFLKASSPVSGVSDVGNRCVDLNEKENISESNNKEKDNFENQSKKYVINKNHNFQEALRIDELENELNKMKSHLNEKDKKINVLESESQVSEKVYKPKCKNIGTDVNTKCYENRKFEDKRKNNSDHKLFDEFLINSSNKIIYGADQNGENISFNNPEEYSSIKDYNPNNSSALRNKIKDLESQIQDLQEANENAAQFMLSFKQNDLMESSNKTNAIVSELIDKNQLLREEVDRLHKSLPSVKGDTISSQFLRQELENLKEDLYTLKHQNNLIVMENIALKTELKKKEKLFNYHTKHEDCLRSGEGSNRFKNDDRVYRSNSNCVKDNNDFFVSRPSKEMDLNPPTYQVMENIKQNVSDFSDPSKNISDSDNSIDILPPNNLSCLQSKPVSTNISSMNSSDLPKQLKKICKIKPHNVKKTPHLYLERNIHQTSEFEGKSYVTEKYAGRMNNDNCSYEKNTVDISNDSTDSILSDANKEMEEIIFQSEIENNIQTFSTITNYEKTFDYDMHKDKSKKDIDVADRGHDLHNNIKFSTLGRTAYAPRASYDINIGDIVKFIRQGGRISKGLVHFIGHLPSRKDTYLGIELEIEDGKHDGIYEGKRYFQCIKNKGVFVAFNKIIMVYSRKN